MTGRTGLIWVTALTVVSLLLGGGALSAFAEHGDKGKGGGQANSAAHQQQQTHKPEVTTAGNDHDKHEDQVKHANNAQQVAEEKHEDKENVRHRDNDDDDDLITRPERVTDEVRPGKGCGDVNHQHERNDECKKDHDDDDDQGAVDDDNDDGD